MRLIFTNFVNQIIQEANKLIVFFFVMRDIDQICQRNPRLFGLFCIESWYYLISPSVLIIFGMSENSPDVNFSPVIVNSSDESDLPAGYAALTCPTDCLSAVCFLIFAPALELASERQTFLN